MFPSMRSNATMVALDHLGSRYHLLGDSPHAFAAFISANVTSYVMCVGGASGIGFLSLLTAK